MSVVQTLIGNIKGPKGDTGSTGSTGAQGPAATITVGTTSTTAYGNAAQVTNSGTSSAAVFDFVIPQGRPGEKTTKMGELTLDTITTSTASFPSPAVDDTGAVAFGKIVKFFADTVTALTGKLNTANVVNNLSTTSSGYALDARQGKVLNDSITKIEKYITSISGSASKTLSVPSGSRFLIVTTGAGSTQHAIFSVFRGSTTAIQHSKIGGGSDSTMTHDNNNATVTITNGNTGNGMYIYAYLLEGEYPTG